VLRRGEALVLSGAEMFFSGLDPRVDYSGGVLKLDQPHDAAIVAAGRGITLVPCAFSWPNVLTLFNPRFRPPWRTLPGASRNCGPPRGRLPTGRRSRPP
jgi:hypothetical protein